MAIATTTVSDGRHAYRPQAIGRVFGWFFLATILTSVPAYFVGYHRMLNNPGLITDIRERAEQAAGSRRS
jgi:hypothetical protein